ncbi:unnamed protein product [Psylliodes chrysocephalus]|uniref:Uncharacterized protein n=1 Tax=Psylliodes chrysocephalus TaxID=3402493 RepID=A0A9P0CKK6_9CUCU|nr:unnamed protein product [Psylliodes chrysocephala]
MADINCVLCSEKEGETSKFVKLSAKGIQGIISASKIRKDNIHELFEPFSDDPARVHVECLRVYKNPNNIQNDAKLKLSTQDEAQVNGLAAANAIYHQACSVNFRKGDPIPKKYQDNSKDELRYKPLGPPMEKDKLGFFGNKLYRLGFSILYDEVPKYLQSAIIDKTPNFQVPPGHFCQRIADNVDHNIATIDGQNTFHGMGIIMCKSGPPGTKSNSLSERKIPRCKIRLNAADISAEAKIAIRFFQSLKSNMNKIIFEELILNDMKQNLLDLLWDTSKLLKTPRPGWNGYINVVMIDMNPATHSCVYTTLKFICSEAKKLNIHYLKKSQLPKVNSILQDCHQLKMLMFSTFFAYIYNTFIGKL